MKALKKILAITVLTALLMTMFVFAIPFSAAAYDNTYSFSISGTNTTPPASTHGSVYLYPNTGSSAKTIYWNNYNFRYSKLMIFNSAGRIVECGGDLYSDSSTITGAPQLSVTIPAGGFMVAFGHNNTNLMKAYDVVMEGAMLYNSTMSVIYELYASYSGSTLTIKYNNPKPASSNAISFLFVGNSTTYFNGSPIKFKAMAAAAGIEVDVVYCTMGSSFLEWFADSSHQAGKNLRNILNSRKFDYVVLQDAASANYDRTKPAIDKLMPLITANGAEALLYMRYSAASTVDQIRTNAIKHHNNYTKISRDLDLVCAPIADAFVHYAEKYNDPTTLYASDGGHHSKEGSYLIAATWLYSYLGVNPVGNTYTADLSSSMVQKLQQCAKIAVEEGYPYPGQENEYTENGVTYKNIAKDKSYTVNGSAYSGAWTDAASNGAPLGKYTDGIIAIDGSDTANACWKGSSVDITIDLEKFHNIKNIRVDMYGGTWGIADPAGYQVKVAISQDGKTFTDVGTSTMSAEKVNGDWKFREFNLPVTKNNLIAKYVRVTFADPSGKTAFFWSSEIRVFGAELNNFDESNLAFNKPYTTTATNRNDNWDDDKTRLTDGVKGTANGGLTNYAGWNSTANNTLEIVVDLGKSCYTDTFTAYMAGGNWGIKLPDSVMSMEVLVSDTQNGEFKSVANAPLGSAVRTNGTGAMDNTWSTYTITAKADESVSARYVKFVITSAQPSAFWIDEVEVTQNKSSAVDPEPNPDPEPDVPANLLSGKDYFGTHARDTYFADLTDGNAKDAVSFVNDEWFCFYYHPNLTEEENIAQQNANALGGIGVLGYDLEGVYDLTKIRVNTFLGNYSGIVAPEAIYVEVSLDGETYEEVARTTYEKPADNDRTVAWVEFDLTDVKAQYIRIVFDLNGVMAFLNEVEAYGVLAEVEDPEVVLGDVDNDGDVDSIDYLFVKRYCLGTYGLDEDALTRADANKNGSVDTVDYLLVKRIVLGTYTAN